VLSGGLPSYLQTLSAQYRTVVEYPAPLLLEIAIRGKILVPFLLYSFTLGIIPMLYFWGRFFRVTDIIRDIRIRFILVWILPAFIFFLGVTLWNPGQVIVILPPLFMFLTESLLGLSRDMEEGFGELVGDRFSRLSRRLRSLFSRGALPASFVGVIVTFNIIQFVILKTPISYAAIRAGNAHLSGLIRLTKGNCAPGKTLILAGQMNTQAGYYLPDFVVYCPFPLIFSEAYVPIEAQDVYVSYHHRTSPKRYWVSAGFKVLPILIPDGVDQILIWESDLAKYYQDASRPLKEIRLDGGDVTAYYLDVKPGEKIVYGYHRWSVSSDIL
jgi:hypothetical protein